MHAIPNTFLNYPRFPLITNYKNIKAEPSYVVKFDRQRIAAEMAKILSHSSS